MSSDANPWSVRRARAVHLLGQTPHAEEILTFYAELTEAQERLGESVADRVPAADLLGLVQSPEGEFPRLQLEMLPLDELALPFHDFLSSVADLGTQTIKDGAKALLSHDDDRRLEPLRVAVHAWGTADNTRGEADDIGGRADDTGGRADDTGEKADDTGEKADDTGEKADDTGEKADDTGEKADDTGEKADKRDKGDDFYFYARAFLEPVATSLAQADSDQPTAWTQNFCFACGGPPQVAVIRDLPDALGRRSLTCSMCATEWRFRRLTCPNCGETDADKLPVHTAESIAHVRVDACTTCSRYIKTVDLRKNGTAVPLVDELAAVELDIWAQEQGLTKLRTNVLGL